MAAPWEDVRDVLVRVGFGSPRPSSSSGDILVTSDRDARTRRRRRRSSGSPMRAVADGGDASTPLGVNNNASVGSRRSVGTPAHHRNTNSRRSRNRAKGVRPVHSSPSQLLLDLSPPVRDASNSQQQSPVVGRTRSDGGDEKAEGSLFSTALSPIVPGPRRTSSPAALSGYGMEGEISGADVDLSEVHDMMDRIQQNLTEDLKEISTSINNYDEDRANGASVDQAEENSEGTAGKPGDESLGCQSPLPVNDDGGQGQHEIGIKDASCGDDEPAARPAPYSPSRCDCACDCHKMHAVEEDKTETRTPPKYEYPVPDRESADAPARALCQTAEGVLHRAEVSCVLTCMIADIEQAHLLAIDLQHRSRVSQLQKQLESTQQILSERRLVEKSEQKRREELADSLLVETVTFGARLVEMENYKIERDEMASECKILGRQLASALEQLSKVEAERDDALAAALKDRTLVEIEEMKRARKTGQKSNSDGDQISLKEEAKPLEEEATVLIEAQTPGAEESAIAKDGSPRRVKGSGDSEVEEESLPPLLILPERELVVLFSFLEAAEILSVAELSMLMYSRVDAIFGLGGETSNQEEDAVPPAENNRDRDGMQAEHHSTPTSPPPSGPDEGAGRPIEPREAAPRIRLAGQAQEGAQFIGSAVGNAVSNLLWQRNLEREGNISDSTNKVSAEDDDTSPPSTAGTAKGDLNETITMHTSPSLLKMASKLSPQELSVIIQMRTKIKQLEEELIKGRERQDDLMAELRGIEGVKDFLVSKLRDVERSKMAKIDDADRTEKQIACDQEVIGFLDHKLGHIEMKYVELTSERERLKKEFSEFRKQGQVRVGFLEDQNKLLRDEIADHGSQWKVEKRLLVKEIKNLRSNVAVLQAEGRGMQSELTRLKRELS